MTIAGKYNIPCPIHHRATPSPTLSRTARELFQSRCGLRPAGEVNITRSDKTTTSFTYTNLATLYVNDQ